jgi:phosphatidylinositol glycan class B
MTIISSYLCRLTLAKLAAVEIAMYSLPAHKEFRFLLPALQLIMPYCGMGAAALWSSENSAGPRTRRKAKAGAPDWRKGAVAALLLLQVPMTIFFSVFHQRGQVQVMEGLRWGSNDSILFLTPCHTTPFYSYLHHPIFMRFLDCSPPGKVSSFLSLAPCLPPVPSRATLVFLQDGLTLCRN